jgi:peroxiredoxin family protein
VASRLAALEARLSALEAPEHELAILATSGDLDRLLAALNLATGVAAMGGKAHIFFAFWATPALRRADAKPRKKTLVERMFGWMLPKGTGDLKLSQMHMMGMGTAMMKGRMRALNVPGLEELVQTSAELGVRFHVCSTTMELMGLTMDDLVDYPGLDVCGVASYLEQARGSRMAMMF